MTDNSLASAAREVVKVFGHADASVHALNGVTVTFTRGGFHAIMGPSGSGKSTLLHCLAALDDVTEGTILLGDTDVAALSERQRTLLRRDRVGFIFQAFNLVPTLSARENITLPAKLGGGDVDPDWMERLVTTLGLDDRLDHRPSELSGGQQQRVAAARAFATRPDVVFADEPTGALDSKTSEELLDFMRQVVEDHGQTIVMVTHDPFAATHADRVVFLEDGRIEGEMGEPTVDGVLDHMKQLGG